jgi:hypothetical protein
VIACAFKTSKVIALAFLAAFDGNPIEAMLLMKQRGISAADTGLDNDVHYIFDATTHKGKRNISLVINRVMGTFSLDFKATAVCNEYGSWCNPDGCEGFERRHEVGTFVVKEEGGGDPSTLICTPQESLLETAVTACMSTDGSGDLQSVTGSGKPFEVLLCANGSVVLCAI